MGQSSTHPKTRNQHYVPRSYLKRFTSDGKTIYMFDKIKGRAFNTQIAAVAQESFFYDLPIEAEHLGLDVQMLEKALSVNEGKFNILINEILPAIQTEGITRLQKRELCQHVCYQWIRTREYREAMRELLIKGKQAIVNRMCELNFPGANPKLMPTAVAKPEELLVWHFKYMTDPQVAREIQNALMSFIWLIGVNSTDQPLYTSDNPVVRQAHVHEPVIGGAGINALGAEFAFPLTPDYALLMRERTYFSSNQLNENQPVPLSRDEVDRFNTLQLAQCSRALFCNENNFSEPQRLCNENPDFTCALRERYDVEVLPGKVQGGQIEDICIVQEKPLRY